jgi:hypothetical protein
MGAFRIGRSRAQHSYPTRNPGLAPALARNFASTFKEEFALTDVETPIPWSMIDAGAPVWDEDVTYQTGDIVSSFGATWISLVDDNIGNDPPFSGAEWARNTIVPITPRVTGVVVIQGVLTLANISAASQAVTGFILVNGVSLPVPLAIADDLGSGDETISMPFLAEVSGLPLGVRADVEVALGTTTDGGVDLAPDSTTIEVREMQAATG